MKKLMEDVTIRSLIQRQIQTSLTLILVFGAIAGACLAGLYTSQGSAVLEIVGLVFSAIIGLFKCWKMSKFIGSSFKKEDLERKIVEG